VGVAIGQSETHLLAAHTVSTVHAVPHAPQFALSFVVSVHAVPHSVVVPEHTHAPAVHVKPVVQALPQVPQFIPSVIRSVHISDAPVPQVLGVVVGQAHALATQL